MFLVLYSRSIYLYKQQRKVITQLNMNNHERQLQQYLNGELTVPTAVDVDAVVPCVVVSSASFRDDDEKGGC